MQKDLVLILIISHCELQLERWAEAVRDYEVLRRELPDDNEVAESLFHAQVALKKSRGEEVYNMKFGGEVEEVSGLEQFRAAISLPGKQCSYILNILNYLQLTTHFCPRSLPFYCHAILLSYTFEPQASL